MKSRVKSLYDYKQTELEKQEVVTGVQHEVDSLVRRIVKNYKTTKKANSVEKGDVVLLKLESNLPKFNKKSVPLNVGKNLFSEELEQQLIGMEINETKELSVDGEKVTTTVLSVTRTIYPELTDQMVAEQIPEDDMDFGGIKTAEELIKTANEKYFHDLKEQMIYNGVNNLCAEMFEKSEWDFDEQELKDYAEFVYKTETEFYKEQGFDVDNMESEEDYIKAFGDIHNREELLQVVDDIARDTIATYLMACGIYNINPETVDIYDEDSAPDIVKVLYEYISNNIEFIKEEVK